MVRSNMNCMPDEIAPKAGGHGHAVLSFIASETTTLTSSPEALVARELELEAEMNRRAQVMTEVLARIMEEPAAFRHWGLNE